MHQPSDKIPIVNLLNDASRLIDEGDIATGYTGLLACFEHLAALDDASIETFLADLSPGALRLVAAHALSELRDAWASAEGRSDN